MRTAPAILLSLAILVFAWATPVWAQFPRGGGDERDRGDRGERERGREGEGGRGRFGGGGPWGGGAPGGEGGRPSWGGGDSGQGQGGRPSWGGGQGGEGGRPSWGGGGREGDGGGGGFRFDPREMLTRMDANGDGILESKELEGRGAGFVQRMAERANVPTDKPIQISALVTSYEAARGGEQDRSRDASSSTSPRSSGGAKITPLVPGFGVDAAQPPVPGFGPAFIQVNTTPLEDRYEQWVIDQVNDTMRRYDKNSDTMLDQAEWGEVTWSTDPRESDTNKDNVLTRDEMAERFAKRQGKGWKEAGKPTTPAATGSEGGPSKTGGFDATAYARDLMSKYDENENSVLDKDEYSRIKGDWAAADYDRNGSLTVEEIARKASEGASGGSSKSTAGGGSTRPMSPTERLPKGLPSWFAKSDTDGDGQVTVAEYASPWSESKAVEFQKWDLNGDGFVPPEECLLAENGGQRPATSGGSSSSSKPSGGGFSLFGPRPPSGDSSRGDRPREGSGGSDSYGSDRRPRGRF